MTSTPLLLSDNNSKKPKGGKRFQPGVSGNPKGAPSHKESWGGIINKIGNMTPLEISRYLFDTRKKLKKLGEELEDTVTMKEVVIMRAYATLAFESNSSLMNALMDRGEGKVPNTIIPANGDPSKPLLWADVVAGMMELDRQIKAEEEEVEQDFGQDSDVVDGVVNE
jgi:hypothetical protein